MVVNHNMLMGLGEGGGGGIARYCWGGGDHCMY